MAQHCRCRQRSYDSGELTVRFSVTFFSVKKRKYPSKIIIITGTSDYAYAYDKRIYGYEACTIQKITFFLLA